MAVCAGSGGSSCWPAHPHLVSWVASGPFSQKHSTYFCSGLMVVAGLRCKPSRLPRPLPFPSTCFLPRYCWPLWGWRWLLVTNPAQKSTMFLGCFASCWLFTPGRGRVSALPMALGTPGPLTMGVSLGGNEPTNESYLHSSQYFGSYLPSCLFIYRWYYPTLGLALGAAVASERLLGCQWGSGSSPLCPHQDVTGVAWQDLGICSKWPSFKGAGGIPIPGGVQGKPGCGTQCSGVGDKVGTGHRLDSMTLEVFSSFCDSGKNLSI